MEQLTETETEYFGGPNARAGRIDSYTFLNLYAGYQINDNYRIRQVLIMQLTLNI